MIIISRLAYLLTVGVHILTQSTWESWILWNIVAMYFLLDATLTQILCSLVTGGLYGALLAILQLRQEMVKE